MLIKGVVSKDSKTARRGDPIALSAEEALPSALLYGVKKNLNSGEKTYWIERGSVKTTAFRKSVLDAKTGAWVATAAGTVMVGHHVHAGDKSHVARPYAFNIEYKSGEDDNGMPDVEVVSIELEPAAAASPKLDLKRYEQAKPVSKAVPAPMPAEDAKPTPAKPEAKRPARQ